MQSESQRPMLRWAYLPECTVPPKGWHVGPFTNIATVVAGQSPPSETYNEKGQGLPFLQGNADFSSVSPAPRLWCSVPAKKASRGDTLISVRAPVGEMNRADQEYAIGRGLAAIQAKDGCDPDFLFHALHRWRWSLQRVAQGTTFDAITARHFAQLCVCVPLSTDEQVAIARILDSVNAAHEQTSVAIDRARDLKTATLQRFFFDALGETAYADRPRKILPNGWELCPTRRLLAGEPKNGLSPESSTQPPGVPTFSIAAIRDGRVQLSDSKHLKFARIEGKIPERYQVCSGDILIVRGNANPALLGAAGVVDSFPDGCIYPDITMRIAFRNDCQPRVLPEFGVLAWNHAVVHNQILRRAKTSNGTLKINSRDVNQIVIPVPTIDEQVAICRGIRTIDSLTDKLVAVADAQQQLKKSLMHDLLTGSVRVGDVSKEVAS